MKAWIVFEKGSPEYAAVVIAPTERRARWLGYDRAAWPWDWYIDIRAIRGKEWDDISAEEAVYDTNEEMPEGSKPFWDDDVL